MAKEVRTPVAKCTVQIVDVTDGAETHVKKLTITLPGPEVERLIRERFARHLYSRPKKAARVE